MNKEQLKRRIAKIARNKKKRLVAQKRNKLASFLSALEKRKERRREQQEAKRAQTAVQKQSRDKANQQRKEAGLVK